MGVCTKLDDVSLTHVVFDATTNCSSPSRCRY